MAWELQRRPGRSEGFYAILGWLEELYWTAVRGANFLVRKLLRYLDLP